MNNIPQIFASEDMIYHYCDANTAFEHILYDRRLRLSPRSKSRDPIENQKPLLGYHSSGYSDEQLEKIRIETQEDSDRLSKEIREYVEHNKQLSFCMNDINGEYTKARIKPLDYYGFLKPRMWDQYGDSYKGVCLAFSRREIEKESKFLFKEVEYVEYSILEFNNSDINLNHLQENGYESVKKTTFKKIERQFFQKHKDYEGEREYRICSFSPNQYDYIDISNSLKGIIISDEFMTPFARSAIISSANKMGVEIRRVFWRHTGVIIDDNESISYLENKLN